MKPKTTTNILLIIICLVIASVIVGFKLNSHTKPYTSLNLKLPVAESEGIVRPNYKIIFPRTNTSVYVEIADTRTEIAQGLSGRENLPDDQGMLFDLGYDNTYPTFWMIGMKFDLDMIWIKDNVVVDITKNAQAPVQGVPTSELPIYRPNAQAGQILEVNAGFSDTHNIVTGDALELVPVE